MRHNYLHLEIKVKIKVNRPKRLLNTSTHLLSHKSTEIPIVINTGILITD